MATTPDLKVDIKVDATKLRRRFGGHLLALELSSEVTHEQIESVLETLRANEGHDKSNADARWIAEVTPQFEKMVTDGLAWLLATQEYIASLEEGK